MPLNSTIICVVWVATHTSIIIITFKPEECLMYMLTFELECLARMPDVYWLRVVESNYYSISQSDMSYHWTNPHWFILHIYYITFFSVCQGFLEKYFLAGAERIELSSAVLETVMLPLHHTPMTCEFNYSQGLFLYGILLFYLIAP